MVLFGVENQKHTFSKKLSNNTDAYLVIITNEITNEIIQSIDRLNKNIIFQIPYNSYTGSAKRDITFDFKVDIWVWNTFIKNIEYLEFRGKLVKNQLNVQHFECMTCVRGLYIGSTDYPLFDNEDILNLAKNYRNLISLLRHSKQTTEKSTILFLNEVSFKRIFFLNSSSL
jgi:hypothetical protein